MSDTAFPVDEDLLFDAIKAYVEFQECADDGAAPDAAWKARAEAAMKRRMGTALALGESVREYGMKLFNQQVAKERT